MTTTTAAAGAPERCADEGLVDKAVAHLRRVVVVGQIETAVAVGQYLIEEFYGSVEAARSLRPTKPASLARLAERAEEFGMSPATLAYAVPTALAVRELGAGLSGRLGISRVRALLPVKDVTQRKLLAEHAVSSSWPVAQLKARVREIAPAHAGGRPARPAVQRLVERTAKLFEEEAADAAALRRGADELSPKMARALLVRLNRLKTAQARVEELLVRAATAAARPEEGAKEKEREKKR